MQTDLRWHSAAAERNRAPILVELQRLLPADGLMLEIASGSGQHAAHFAAAMPRWRWQPSDPDAGALASIGAWCADLPNVLPPLQLDVCTPSWSGVPIGVDAVFCANLLHIAPWAATPALLRGAARQLAPKGLLILYGPYLVDGEAPAASNLAFDADLRSRNPAWGLRELGVVLHEARGQGLLLRERVAMPANNLLLVLAKGST
jgi:SAM-dependent methyltransferase